MKNFFFRWLRPVSKATERKKRMLKVLIKAPIHPFGHAICTQLQYAGFNTEDYQHLMDSWPDHSGNRRFPVPSPLEHWDGPVTKNPHNTRHPSHPAWAFENLSRWTGPYGASRMSLLAHMIDELKKEIAKGD